MMSLAMIWKVADHLHAGNKRGHMTTKPSPTTLHKKEVSAFVLSRSIVSTVSLCIHRPLIMLSASLSCNAKKPRLLKQFNKLRLFFHLRILMKRISPIQRQRWNLILGCEPIGLLVPMRTNFVVSKTFQKRTRQAQVRLLFGIASILSLAIVKPPFFGLAAAFDGDGSLIMGPFLSTL